ncbi:phage major capsid protein [Lactococcus lactis]|uniref:phage major capsid protein n=1 Tax=Lactococcus lactis TaxID=1358 RepID=UPI000559B995|nr:phage major capsid protein [Lactococcus lactis]AJA56876.1 HK97 family phage major capsid protein [Lactococcus lactis subsp. lactis]WBM78460.1 phage major capsid protein [Lactococcus lactis]WSP32909.1 phage major capsid protein [Lactococcus lactis subsp. lactis]
MVLNKANLFDPELVTDLINKVTGKSSIARLSAQQAIPFNGEKVFTFTMDSEIDVIAESGKKTHGGVSLTPQTMVPIKVEYGARISDEFMYASDEEKINILQAFNDGFAKKVARGIDLMAFHGVNPRQGTASAVIGTNNFDSKVTQKVSAPKGIADANGAIESAVELLTGADADVTGIAINPSFRSALAKQKDQQGNALFPELKWGATPDTINGLPVDVNKTVSDMSTENDRAIVGDFANGFKWGYAKEVPLEVIQFGDPDNSGLDLKGYNQVYIRAELYLGWGILDATKFARVTEAAE